MSFEERLAQYHLHREIIDKRDDLYIEYITLLNLSEHYEEAYAAIMGHRFHPWEGGEGKVPLSICLLCKLWRKGLERTVSL